MFTLKKHNIEGGYEYYRNNILVARTTIESIMDFHTFLGVDEKELKFALEKMEENDHKYAEFGINGGFIYSHNGKENKCA